MLPKKIDALQRAHLFEFYRLNTGEKVRVLSIETEEEQKFIERMLSVFPGTLLILLFLSLLML